MFFFSQGPWQLKKAIFLEILLMHEIIAAGNVKKKFCGSLMRAVRSLCENGNAVRSLRENGNDLYQQ